MGLLKIIRKLKAKEREMRIVVVGLDNAGKTTLLKKLKGEDTSLVAPTVGFNIETLELDEYALTFWDIGGQKSLRAFWRNYFEETDGVVWVVDSADEGRCEEGRRELQRLVDEERLQGASLLVLANKRDLASAIPLDELRRQLGLTGIDRHLLLAPTDARSGQGLEEAIRWLVNDIAARIYI